MKKADIVAAINSGTLLALDPALGQPTPVKVLAGHPTEPGRWKVQRPDSDRVFNASSRDLLGPWDAYLAKRDAEGQERARRRADRNDYERRQSEFLVRLASAVSAASGHRWVATYSGIRQDDVIDHDRPRGTRPDLTLQVGTPGALLLCDLLSLLPDGRPMSTTPLTDLTPEDVAYILEREGHFPAHIAALVDFSQANYSTDDLEAIRSQLP